MHSSGNGSSRQPRCAPFVLLLVWRLHCIHRLLAPVQGACRQAQVRQQRGLQERAAAAPGRHRTQPATPISLPAARAVFSHASCSGLAAQRARAEPHLGPRQTSAPCACLSSCFRLCGVKGVRAPKAGCFTAEETGRRAVLAERSVDTGRRPKHHKLLCDQRRAGDRVSIERKASFVPAVHTQSSTLRPSLRSHDCCIALHCLPIDTLCCATVILSYLNVWAVSPPRPATLQPGSADPLLSRPH